MRAPCKVKRYSWQEGGRKGAHPDFLLDMPLCSRAVVAGNLVFLNSLDGRSMETGRVISRDVEDQLVLSLDNIRLTLEEAESSLNHMVKLFVLLKDYRDTPAFWKVMREYFQKYAPELIQEPPAVTVTQVEALARPECLVEIDAIAVMDKDAPGWEMKKYVQGDVKRVSPGIVPGSPFLSESVAVGNLIFLSAMNGENPETGEIETGIFEEQWSIALRKVHGALNRTGSSFSNLIKTLHFQCRLDAMLQPSEDVFRSHSPASDRLWKTELEFFEKHASYLLEEFPGSTFLKVSSLSDPKTLGQTETIGVFDRFRPGWEVKKYPTYIGRRGFPRHVGDIKKYYSNVVKVGPLLLVSGQTATDAYTARIESADFEDQLLTALKNLRDSLEEAGSSLENLIKTYVLLPKPDLLPKMKAVEYEFYKKYAPGLLKEPPAVTVIHPYNLASPAMLIEIDAIAVVPDV